MLLSILLLTLLTAAGYKLLARFSLKLYLPERWAAAFVLAIFFGAWLIFLLNLIFSFAIALIASIVLLLIFLILSPNKKTDRLYFPKSIWLSFSLFLLAILTYLFSRQTLYPVGDSLNSSAGSWGDLPLHIGLIKHFAINPRFNWDFPYLIGSKLTYPFLMDYFSSVLLRLGISLRYALLLPGLLTIFAFCQLFYFFAFRLFRSQIPAVLSLLIFLFNGSWLGTIYFWRDWRLSGLSLWYFLKNLRLDYAYNPTNSLQFNNILVSHLLPQRAMTLGIAVFLLFILLGFLSDKASGRRPLLLAGVLIGLLPFVHAHVFFFALLIVIIMAILDKDWRLTLIIALALSLPQLIWQFLANSHFNKEVLSFGYLIPPTIGAGDYHLWLNSWSFPFQNELILFWLANAGLVLLLALVGLILQRKASRFMKVCLLSSGLILLTLNILAFVPYFYEQQNFLIQFAIGFSLLCNKFTTLIWLFVAMLTAGSVWYLVKIPTLHYSIKSKKKYEVIIHICFRVIILVVISSLLIPGLLSVWTTARFTYPLYSADSEKLVSAINQIVPIQTNILTTCEHNNPISSMTGRQTVMGYPGWLLSYGYSIATIQSEINKIWSGEEGVEQYITKYHINYAIFQRDRNSDNSCQQKINQQYFLEKYPLMKEVDGWYIFKLS